MIRAVVWRWEEEEEENIPILDDCEGHVFRMHSVENFDLKQKKTEKDEQSDQIVIHSFENQVQLLFEHEQLLHDEGDVS